MHFRVAIERITKFYTAEIFAKLNTLTIIDLAYKTELSGVTEQPLYVV